MDYNNVVLSIRKFPNLLANEQRTEQRLAEIHETVFSGGQRNCPVAPGVCLGPVPRHQMN